MTHYQKPRSKSGKKDYSKGGYRKDQSGPNRGSSGSSGQNRRRGGGAQRRVQRKFDPSMFLKKVEEQVAAPVYVPKHMFADFAIEDQIKQNIASKGYITPTPIQDQTIPTLLEGTDVIGTANTGTGKTAAFLIPLINNVLTKKTSRVLIIAPTRELADQINTELKSFKHKTGIYSVVCIGGANMNVQIRELSKNPQFVIGTPGRLIDLEKNRYLNFHDFTSIVLDEVDTMLDMGFINDIKYIIQKLPSKRHSLFFSATIPPVAKNLMAGFLRNPVTVSVKTRQSAENVNQEVIKVGQQSKVELLHDVLNKP